MPGVPVPYSLCVWPAHHLWAVSEGILEEAKRGKYKFCGAAGGAVAGPGPVGAPGPHVPIVYGGNRGAAAGGTAPDPPLGAASGGPGKRTSAGAGTGAGEREGANNTKPGPRGYGAPGPLEAGPATSKVAPGPVVGTPAAAAARVATDVPTTTSHPHQDLVQCAMSPAAAPMTPSAEAQARRLFHQAVLFTQGGSLTTVNAPQLAGHLEVDVEVARAILRQMATMHLVSESQGRAGREVLRGPVGVKALGRAKAAVAGEGGMPEVPPASGVATALSTGPVPTPVAGAAARSTTLKRKAAEMGM